jgi:hypothetical protein
MEADKMPGATAAPRMRKALNLAFRASHTPG